MVFVVSLTLFVAPLQDGVWGGFVCQTNDASHYSRANRRPKPGGAQRQGLVWSIVGRVELTNTGKASASYWCGGQANTRAPRSSRRS
jgi:hypothetical protein